MLRGILLAICFSAIAKVDVTLGAEPPLLDQLPDQAKDYANVLRPQLPPGWRCTYDFRTLVISDDEQVTFLNRIGLPPGKRDDAYLEEFGVKGPYLIVLKFVPRLSEADQRALADRRRQAVEAARKAHAGEKYSGEDDYSQHFVPEWFNYRFSIDLQTSEVGPLTLEAPGDVVKQRDAIERLVHANLRAYPAQQ